MGILDNILSREGLEGLALGFNQMRLRPDPNLAANIAQRQQYRRKMQMDQANRQSAIDFFKDKPGGDRYIAALNAGGSGAGLVQNYIAAENARRAQAASRVPRSTVKIQTLGDILPEGTDRSSFDPAMLNLPVPVTYQNGAITGVGRPIQGATPPKAPEATEIVTAQQLLERGGIGKSVAANLGQNPTALFKVTSQGSTITDIEPYQAPASPNKTINYLRNTGFEELANAVENGVITASSALEQALKKQPGATDQTAAGFEQYANGLSIQNFKGGRQVYNVPTIKDGQNTIERIVIEADGTSTTENANEKIAKALIDAQQFDVEQAKKLSQSESDIKVLSANRDEALKNLSNLDSRSANLNAALDAVNRGARSGVIEKYLPAFNAATADLRAAANSLGLDIVGATTFGALSAGELELSLKTALDISLPTEQLKEVIERKISAIQKTREQLLQAVLYLSQPGATVEEYTRQFIIKPDNNTAIQDNASQKDLNILTDVLEKLED